MLQGLAVGGRRDEHRLGLERGAGSGGLDGGFTPLKKSVSTAHLLHAPRGSELRSLVLLMEHRVSDITEESGHAARKKVTPMGL